jgi:hypothetical protein
MELNATEAVCGDGLGQCSGSTLTGGLPACRRPQLLQQSQRLWIDTSTVAVIFFGDRCTVTAVLRNFRIARHSGPILLSALFLGS